MHDRFTYATCVHFRGMSAPCGKGVELKDVADDEGRVPCCVIRGISGAVACDMRQIPDTAPRGAPGPASEMLNAMLAGNCPKCGTKINGEMEFNDSILAMPCRHVIRSARD